MIKVTFTNPSDQEDQFTSDQLDFYIKHRKLGGRKARTNYVEIPGRDGVLDLTEIFGSTYYDDGEIELECMLQLDSEASQFEKIERILNGKRWNIVFSDIPKITYTGRATVDELEWKNSWWQFDITIIREA